MGWTQQGALTPPLPLRLAAAQSNHAISDANTATDTGFYWLQSGASNNGPSTSTDWMLTVNAFGSTYVSQIATSTHTDDVWIRHNDGGTWSAWVPMATGAEMAYSESQVNWTTTNTTVGNTATSAVVTGLQCIVVGEGKPVDIEFEALVQHSVASSLAASYLLVNGSYSTPAPAGMLGAVSLGATGTSRSLRMRRRYVLTKGTQYTFTVGMYSATAGTITVVGAAAFPAMLAVTRR